jgi:hypothetical protein
MRFLDFYNLELYEIDITNIHLLTEINKNELMNATDLGRIERAKKELRVRPPTVTYLNNGIERLEYNFKAKPSTEFRNHLGYCDHKDDDIIKLFCDCKDFFFRLYAPLVKNKIADWDIPTKYTKRENKLNTISKPVGYGGMLPHNREWTKKTNPTGKLFVCKHLYALISEYI